MTANVRRNRAAANPVGIQNQRQRRLRLTRLLGDFSMGVHPTVLRLAQRIQFIEHGGRHTWETCMQTARDRAIEQAKACLAEMNLIFKGCFLADDNSDPPQLWVWRGEPGDETAEPWQRVTGLE